VEIALRKAEEAATFRTFRKDKHTLSWSSGEAALILRAIVAITDNGGSILFGRRRDGTSLNVKVYMGDDGTNQWLDLSSEIKDCMDWLLETYG
jgi:hypothetical protein